MIIWYIIIGLHSYATILLYCYMIIVLYYYIILLYFFTLPVINHSQIKTIYATGGESKVNWDLIQKEIEDPNFDGYPSRIAMGSHGYPWVSMEIRGNPWMP